MNCLHVFTRIQPTKKLGARNLGPVAYLTHFEAQVAGHAHAPPPCVVSGRIRALGRRRADRSVWDLGGDTNQETGPMLEAGRRPPLSSTIDSTNGPIGSGQETALSHHLHHGNGEGDNSAGLRQAWVRRSSAAMSIRVNPDPSKQAEDCLVRTLRCQGL